jgi:hypothetical protein
VPEPPEGLTAASVAAWSAWFGSWFAAFWCLEDLPALRQLIRLYDRVERGDFVRAAELRLWSDTYGITPKGRQDRRWRPSADGVAGDSRVVREGGTYGHLRSVPAGDD